MGDFADNQIPGWYLENEVTGSKIAVPKDENPLTILNKFHPDEKKNWCLKWGVIEKAQFQTQSEIQITLPDGSVQNFVDDSSWLERRAFPRKKITMLVTLISGRRIFRCQSENVSLGGIMLNTVPPRDYAHPELKILLESSDGTFKMLLSAEFVEGHSQKRLAFKDIKESQLKTFAEFLEKNSALVNLKKVA